MRDIRAPWSLYGFQQRFFNFRPPRGTTEVSAVLGGWSSGKTQAAAAKVIRLATLNGWHSAYGNDTPIGLIMAPTLRTIRQVSLKRLLSMIPREAILKKRGPPSYEVQLNNGLTLLPASYDSDIEGLTCAFVWLDEVQLINSQEYSLAFSRIRDPFAKRPAVIASGLPYAGFVREKFDLVADNHQTILCGLHDNPILTESFKSELRGICPAGREGVLLDGKWGVPEGLVWPQFDSRLHLKDWRVDWNIPGHIGWDPGTRSAIMFAQPKETQLKDGSIVTGLFVVDEIIALDMSMDAICKKIQREKPWKLVPSISKITPDPTSRPDEVNALEMNFPGVWVVRHRKGRPGHSREYGYDTIAAALLDGDQNTRLWFARDLARRKHGIIDSIQSFARNPDTGKVIKTNMPGADHAADALRYLGVTHLARERPGPSLIQ